MNMNLSKVKNIVILKNLPSNCIEEAIVVVKEKSKIPNIDKINKRENIIYSMMQENEFKKFENIKKEKRKYIIKEAEMVVNDFLTKIEENKKYEEKIKMKKTYRRLKYSNIILIIVSILSTMICFMK